MRADNAATADHLGGGTLNPPCQRRAPCHRRRRWKIIPRTLQARPRPRHYHRTKPISEGEEIKSRQRGGFDHPLPCRGAGPAITTWILARLKAWARWGGGGASLTS